MSESAFKLPARWTQLRPHPVQLAYWNSPHRFNTVPAGRRSGKTERFKRKLVCAALNATTSWAPRFFAGAPTRDQAKRIFWDDLKALVGRDMMRKAPSESDLTIYLLTGADIVVVGLDKPERIEGSPWDGGGVDEIGNAKASAWPQNIRPALADRRGWCDFIGVPEGRNHYYDMTTKARAMQSELGAASEWGSYTWPSSDILPAEEIEAMRRDLDELTFDQECNASFISFEGRAYYPFNSLIHCAPLKYDERAPLLLCFDFNVAPGVCAVVQEQALPGQFEHDAKTGVPLLSRPLTGDGVIGEVHIPKNSSTPAICRKAIADWGKHLGQVRCYGDPTGGNKGTAKVAGSDWDLIEAELRPVFGSRLSFRVKGHAAAGIERGRINAINSRLLSVTKDIRLMVDAARAPHMVKDLEGVVLLKGGAGELDKAATPELTHLTDALGYFEEYEHPVDGPSVMKVRLGGV